MPPMRGGPPAIEQPGGGHGECSGAVRQHPSSAVDRGAQSVLQLRRRFVVVVPRGAHHQVGGGQTVESMLGHDLQPGVGAQWTGLAGDHRVIEAGQPVGGPVEAEHLAEQA